MTEPNAEVIADSVSPDGHRLTTLEVTMHRFVLAEFNTHRLFSRNSASSRAIPFPKQVNRVINDVAVPTIWTSEQKGMQGGDEVTEPEAATEVWEHARDLAVESARALAELGVHKSLCNRLLEPFMWHTVIVTATDWNGFWRQRCSPLAQPEIMIAATMMRQAYFSSYPTKLEHGEWHLPFIDERTLESIEFGVKEGTIVVDEKEAAKRISVARCARVSYLTHDGNRDPVEDLNMFDRLVSADPPHASPLEHVATPCVGHPTPPGGFRVIGVHDPGHLGNLTGWDQMRHQVLDF